MEHRKKKKKKQIRRTHSVQILGIPEGEGGKKLPYILHYATKNNSLYIESLSCCCEKGTIGDQQLQNYSPKVNGLGGSREKYFCLHKASRTFSLISGKF